MFLPSACAPKTSYSSVEACTTAYVLLSTPQTGVQLTYYFSFFSFRGYNRSSYWYFSWWVCTCISSPSCNDHLSISTSCQSFHGGEVIRNPKHKPGKTFFLIQKFMMNIENLHISYMLFNNMKSLAWIYINFGSVIYFFYQKGQESVIWACGLRILGKFM